MEEHFPSENLRATDDRARNGAVAPRVTLDGIIAYLAARDPEPGAERQP